MTLYDLHIRQHKLKTCLKIRFGREKYKNTNKNCDIICRKGGNEKDPSDIPPG
jgi:hypothetical protein